MDNNMTGKIAIKEFKQAMINNSVELSDADIITIFQLLDTDRKSVV